MSGAGRVVAFGLVFFGLTCALSLVMGIAWLASRRLCQRLGVSVERRAAALAIVLPPLLGLAVTLALIGRSLLGSWAGAPDHCPAHTHHLHLCLYHAAEWTRQPWAVAAFAGATALLLTRLGQRTLGMWKARSALQALGRVAQPLAGGEPGILLALADTPFCFVAGLRRPRIFVATAAWDLLDDNERRAVIEHEKAHLRLGDLWRRPLLGSLGLFGFPVLVTRTLAGWDHATERLCDSHSVRAVGDPTTVARALVVLAKAGSARAVPCAAAFVSRCNVTDRVEAILDAGPEGDQAARRLGIVAALSIALVTVGSSTMAEPLHHALETLLGAH